MRNVVLHLVQSKEEIERAQRQFRSEIEDHLDGEEVYALLNRRKETVPFLWSDSFGMWACFTPSSVHPEREVNAFGLHDPTIHTQQNAVVEVNFPLPDVNIRTASGFARDDDGNLFIVRQRPPHNVGWEEFAEGYEGEWRTVENRGRIKEMPLIGQVGSENLAEQVHAFVEHVQAIRQRVRGK